MFVFPDFRNGTPIFFIKKILNILDKRLFKVYICSARMEKKHLIFTLKK